MLPRLPSASNSTSLIKSLILRQVFAQKHRVVGGSSGSNVDRIKVGNKNQNIYSCRNQRFEVSKHHHCFLVNDFTKHRRIPAPMIYSFSLCKFFHSAVLRIRDVYPGSRILIFTHPESRILDPGSWIPDPGSRISDPGSKNINKREVKKN